MFAQLGNIVFDGVLGIDGMPIKGEEYYAEHALINTRPQLAHTGTSLRTISLTMQFHFQFCTPEDQFTNLWSAKSSATILPFVLGNGRVIGNFVITDIEEVPVQCAPDGTYICAKAIVGLKEVYFSPAQKQNQLQIAAKNNAIAISDNNPLVVPIRSRAWITAMWDAMEKAMIIRTIAAAAANMVKYAANPDFWLSATDATLVFSTIGLDAVNQLLLTIGATPALVALCPTITADTNSVLDALNNIVTLMPITDITITPFNDASTAFTTTQKQLDKTMLPMHKLVIVRSTL